MPAFLSPTPAWPNVLLGWGCTIQKNTLKMQTLCLYECVMLKSTHKEFFKFFLFPFFCVIQGDQARKVDSCQIPVPDGQASTRKIVSACELSQKIDERRRWPDQDLRVEANQHRSSWHSGNTKTCAWQKVLKLVLSQEDWRANRPRENELRDQEAQLRRQDQSIRGWEGDKVNNLMVLTRSDFFQGGREKKRERDETWCPIISISQPEICFSQDQGMLRKQNSSRKFAYFRGMRWFWKRMRLIDGETAHVSSRQAKRLSSGINFNAIHRTREKKEHHDLTGPELPKLDNWINFEYKLSEEVATEGSWEGDSKHLQCQTSREKWFEGWVRQGEKNLRESGGMETSSLYEGSEADRFGQIEFRYELQILHKDHHNSRIHTWQIWKKLSSDMNYNFFTKITPIWEYTPSSNSDKTLMKRILLCESVRIFVWETGIGRQCDLVQTRWGCQTDTPVIKRWNCKLENMSVKEFTQQHFVNEIIGRGVTKRHISTDTRFRWTFLEGGTEGRDLHTR